MAHIPDLARPIRSMAEAVKESAGIAGNLPHEKGAPVKGAQAFTTFTAAVPSPDPLISSPPNAYLHVRLMLETVGPVAWGFLQNISPPGSGKGRLLIQNVEQEIWMPPSTRIYLAATGPNRVGVSVEPMPVLQEILNAIRALAGGNPGAK